MSILTEIFAYKQGEVEQHSRLLPLNDLKAACSDSPPALDFQAVLLHTYQERKRPALIAEIKRASPSRGLLLKEFDPLRLASIYQKNGAAAVSILTDEHFFLGNLNYLRQVRAAFPRLPLLRKDFIFDPYQVYEARAAGADAVLLIAAQLNFDRLSTLFDLSQYLGMAALTEVHNAYELHIAMDIGANLIGVNNRDLHTFSVDLQTTLSLAPSIPSNICLVSESGIQTTNDINKLADAGVTAILVGEALVAAPDIASEVSKLAW